MEITRIEEMKKYAEGIICELPEFGPGQPFVARLRKPSLLSMVKSGKIPNPLLDNVAQAFGELKQGKAKSNSIAARIAETYDLMIIQAKACLLEPTYDEIREAGLELTDAQLNYINNFVQAGNQEAANFR